VPTAVPAGGHGAHLTLLSCLGHRFMNTGSCPRCGPWAIRPRSSAGAGHLPSRPRSEETAPAGTAPFDTGAEGTARSGGDTAT